LFSEGIGGLRELGLDLNENNPVDLARLMRGSDAHVALCREMSRVSGPTCRARSSLTFHETQQTLKTRTSVMGCVHLPYLA
jgi:hypothetical protein